MLSVQPVNLINKTSFGSVRENDFSDRIYEKKQYEEDKSKLEEQLEDLNEVIQNTSMPKPIRVAGKVATVGIGAALGFVSLKYGAQGVSGVVKKGYAYMQKLAAKPNVKSALEKAGNFANKTKDSIVNIGKELKDSKYAQKLSDTANNIIDKFKNTKFAQKLSGAMSKLEDTKFAKSVKDMATNAKETANNKIVQPSINKIKSITKDQVERGIVNVFAVSGGVSGGVTALQEVTKE